MKGLSTVSPKWKYVISQIPLENPTIVDVDLGEGFFTPDDFELYKFKRISILHLFFRRVLYIWVKADVQSSVHDIRNTYSDKPYMYATIC
jgi:hypothetical protein